MHLVAFKHHKIPLFESHHHRHMIKVRISEETLDFSSKILCIKQQNIPCLSSFQEITLGKSVFAVIGKFFECFQHYFILLGVEIKNLSKQRSPLSLFARTVCPQQQIFTFSSEIQQQTLGFSPKRGRQQSQINTCDCLFLFLIFETEQFFASQHHVPLLNNSINTCHGKKKPSVFFYRNPSFRMKCGLVRSIAVKGAHFFRASFSGLQKFSRVLLISFSSCAVSGLSLFG